MRNISLKTKITATVSALIALLVIAMAFLLFGYFEKTLREVLAGQQFTMVKSMAHEIDNKLDTVHSSLIATSEALSPEIIADPDKAQKFLDSQAGIRTMFDNHIFFFSIDGKIIAESPYESGRRGMDFSHREYIQKTLETKQPYIGKPYISSQTHQHPAIMLTAPVYGPEGEIIAIMAGGLDLMKDNFLGALPRTTIGKTGYLYLYNTERTIIIHPEVERMMKQDVPVGSNVLFDRSIQGFEGAEETVNSRGLLMLSASKHLQKTNWILVANHPVDEVYGPLIEAKQFFNMALLLGTLLVILAVWYVVRYYTNPLVLFTRHVEGLGGMRGESRFSTIMPNDEIGALSATFNKMLAELDLKAESLAKSKELYQTVTDFASDMAFWRGPDGTAFYVSPNCERITGYSSYDFYGNPALLDEMVHEDDRAIWFAYSVRPQSTASESLEFRIINADGNVRWISCVSRHVFDDETGVFHGVRGSHQDITERKIVEERLQYMSLRDSLTGFRNRVSFEEDIKSYGRMEYLPLAVFVCDVDGLKFVNDTIGHRDGDALLVKVATILTEVFSVDASIYRIGGDEFVAIMRNMGQNEAETTYRNLGEVITRHNCGNKLPVSVSVGFAVSDCTHADVTALFKEADDNMYRVKVHHHKSVRSATVTALMKAMEVRDFRTEVHSARLQEATAIMGKALELPEKTINELRLLAQFHDIGKVGIPDQILLKPGPLTRREREVMQRHSDIGYRIAMSTPDLAPIAECILKHHEWWNGAGYPLGIKGEEIPLESRVLAIVDAYDAMISERPYRKAVTHQEAIEEIARCAGSQFDPFLVKVFIAEFAAPNEKAIIGG